MSREPQHRITDLTEFLAFCVRLTIAHCPPPIISLPPRIAGLSEMHSGDQESCTSPNSKYVGQATSTSTNISPKSPSTPAGNIAPGQFPINMLLDEVLLEMFACYVEGSWRRDAWHTLACVCQRWRSIAFGSPRRLNLRIFCSQIIPVRENLEFWPPFPIVLTIDYFQNRPNWPRDDNIFATLEHHDRVCQIEIRDISSSLLEKALPLMQKPFP